MHYLPGFVPGSQNIFRPVKIAVPPSTTSLGSGDIEVGRIYRSDGNAQNVLTVSDPARVFTDALIKGLAGAGLSPVPRLTNLAKSHVLPDRGAANRPRYVLLLRLPGAEQVEQPCVSVNVQGVGRDTVVQVEDQLTGRAMDGGAGCV